MRTLAFAFIAAIAASIIFSTGFSTAFADDAAQPSETKTALPLNMGDWEIGGSGSFTRNVRTNLRAVFISPKAEYFFLNRFSAGGSFNYSDDNTSGTAYGIGPSLTYYITHTETTAVSIDQSVSWQTPSSGDPYVRGATGLAFDYFVTPSIAFGPALRGVYFFNGGIAKPDDLVQLAFNFSMFL